jgi:hypothetical protein
MLNRLFFISLVVLSTSGFGFLTTSSSLESDIEDQQDTLDSIFVSYWKGGKISIRSLPINENTKTIDFSAINDQQAATLGLGPHLKKLFDNKAMFSQESQASESADEELSITHIYEFSKELYTMKEKTKHLDEDDYPTFVEVMAHGKRVTSGEKLNYPKPWTNSLDHWAFALVMEARTLFDSWKTYELEKIDINELATTDFKSMASIHKGIDNLRNEWFYLADKSFSDSILELNKEGFSLASSTEALVNNHIIDGFNAHQQTRLILRATSHLMRGWARQQSKDDALMEMASVDIERALEDFSYLGIDNELVWSAESYLYIKKEDTDRALISLNKLSHSELLSVTEKELIEDTKTHLQNREPGKALNFLTDKVFMYRLGFSYAYSYAEEIEWVAILNKSNEGRELLDKLNKLEAAIEKAKEILSLEEMKNKSKSLLGDVI